MKKHLTFIFVMFALIFVGIAILHAQGGSSAFGFYPGPLSSCPAPSATQDFLCDVAGVGIEESIAGAAYAPLAGAAGQPGTPGAAATVTIGSVGTLPAGSTATVTNSGTTGAAVLNFGIPQGNQGPQGNPGPVQSFSSVSCGPHKFTDQAITASGCTEQ